MRVPLASRFDSFLRSEPCVECIDDLALTPRQRGAQIADYFINSDAGRQVIVELKCLRSSMDSKPQDVLNHYRAQPDWPLIYGRHSLEQVLARHPRGREINNRLVDVISSSIEGHFKKANRQIRSTKEGFNLSKARGILILLNEDVGIVSPDIIHYKLQSLWGKRKMDGTTAFSSIDSILVILETHLASLDGNSTVPFLGFQFAGGIRVDGLSCTIEEYISRRWAHFNGLDVRTQYSASLSDLGIFSPKLPRCYDGGSLP